MCLFYCFCLRNLTRIVLRLTLAFSQSHASLVRWCPCCLCVCVLVGVACATCVAMRPSAAFLHAPAPCRTATKLPSQAQCFCANQEARVRPNSGRTSSLVGWASGDEGVKAQKLSEQKKWVAFVDLFFFICLFFVKL